MKLLTPELEARFAAVGCQDGKGFDALAIARFFTPDSGWTWYATEYNPQRREFFGYIIGFEAGMGYFGMDDMDAVRGPLDLPIARDLYFVEQTLREALKHDRQPCPDENGAAAEVRKAGHAEEQESENRDQSCSRRVRGAFESRMQDIRTLWTAPEQETPELGPLCEYGLCMDFVEAGTFTGQRAPYWRYQLCCGGPTEEFRVYLNGEVEFWLLDWFDGACVEVTGEDAATIREIVEMARPESRTETAAHASRMNAREVSA